MKDEQMQRINAFVKPETAKAVTAEETKAKTDKFIDEFVDNLYNELSRTQSKDEAKDKKKANLSIQFFQNQSQNGAYSFATINKEFDIPKEDMKSFLKSLPQEDLKNTLTSSQEFNVNALNNENTQKYII